MADVNSKKTLYYYLHKSINLDFMVKALSLFSVIFICYINIKYSPVPLLEKIGLRQTQTVLTSF